VSLDQLTDRADLQTRRDRKYLVDASVVGCILDVLAGSAAALEIDGLRRFRYESVYFDTPTLASYHASARSRRRRFKVRTRAYLDTGACTLEVKTRDARGRTVKRRLGYAIDDRRRLTTDGLDFVAAVAEVGASAHELAPMLTVSYRRTTLLLPSSATRITIDTDLACTAAEVNTVAVPDITLVEIKTSGTTTAIDRLLWAWGRRPITISKYCTGLAALHPELPANKWNRVLRRHFEWTPRQGGATV
jgi:hypothetical protein